MKTTPMSYLHNRAVKLLMLLFLSSFTANTNLGSNLPSTPPIKTSPFNVLSLDGHFEFQDTQHVAKDFGNRFRFPPYAVLRPESVSDIAAMLKRVYEMGPSSNLTVAARGHGHSLQGQAQALGGIVIEMESLGSREVQIHVGEFPYIDVSGGELWINVLLESLKHGLAPKSWTDYLHLTVGGTLSNAGVSGQAFRHGPQINNVRSLEIITGKGEMLNCSPEKNADLFYGALGGLGQFGVITRARIDLETAPKMVRWIRVLYSDLSTFTEDQEMLISAKTTFDYIEGFVIINRTGLLNNWRSSFDPEDPLQASKFSSDGQTLYCLEMTKNLNPDKPHITNKEVTALLSRLRYISSTLFQSEVSYVKFLDRVQASEVKLRSKGLWEVPHPWLNLLVPKSRIHDFARGVFQEILTDSNNGPILIYPVNKSKWDNRTSLVTPDEDIIYLIGFLSSAMPSSTGRDGLEHVLSQNERILNFCRSSNIAVKQYLPYYTTQEEWRAHFGWRWETFVRRKHFYDPLAILAPGQRIFQKAKPFL